MDSIKEANLHMRKKGGLGVATILMKVHGFVDLVKVVLPSPSAAKLAQDSDNWGEDWVRSCSNAQNLQILISFFKINRLRLVVETD